jgi:hypothetical protein
MRISSGSRLALVPPRLSNIIVDSAILTNDFFSEQSIDNSGCLYFPSAPSIRVK